MRPSKSLVAVSSVLAIGSAILLSAAPAFAYVACNTSGDCWRTGSKVTWPGVTLMFHDDSWRDEHKDEQRYRWHDQDAQHDWHRGYWANGEWMGG